MRILYNGQIYAYQTVGGINRHIYYPGDLIDPRKLLCKPYDKGLLQKLDPICPPE